MPDREKVINGLECCLVSEEDYQCDKCPYRATEDERKVIDWRCHLEELRKDALELLKAQEPRVLTLEEVQNDCPDYVYLETAFGWIECCVKDEGDTAKSVGYFVYGFGEYSIKAWEKYGVTWRCWTAMPTEEQRKAVKWNEAD